ncbi:type II toxin-antitoxin system HipA family toxin [Pseudoclavibacter sp. 13-3]|uniref:type II toxin-antitoxin system HipA family toxin n=1 Tax=Pseudoclavibacter sp. 13-3 TaxID=2901228 RepID=UPI001E2A3010|nr:HipA domain-containing protein [Pseudoclavibacter sp. 13-3]MCD7100951.1 HipA domain-containing protein [Pseudoclavibacter sp. 13-3]
MINILPHDPKAMQSQSQPNLQHTLRIGVELWLAKFPKPVGDDWNVMAWEAAMLDAMQEAGIHVPPHMTKRMVVDGTARTVLFLKRFDRTEDATRIPYISAMTALEAVDGDGADWVDVVDFAQMAGADTTELWRRAVFGALTGNLDDHLRNHGFLRRGPAWALAPAFDVNPTPLGDGNQHQLALMGAHDLELDSFMEKDALDLFSVSQTAAHEFLGRLRPALATLPRYAATHGADALTIEVMAPRIAAATSAVS